MFWRVIYNTLIVPVVRVALPVFGPLDRKIRRGMNGRAGLFSRLESSMAKLPAFSPEGSRIPRVWFHSSSMGEFEQAKPIIAELKRRYSNIQIIVSFFSPSGYDHSRSYKHADVITYIPFDVAADARRFITTVKPTAAVMVRYDVWPNHIWALHDSHVPVYIANATLAANSSRSYPILRQFHYSLYSAINYILTVSESDLRSFEQFKLDHTFLAAIGDTRYDQVIQRSREAAARQLFPAGFFDGKRVLVAGSTWEEDEEALLPALDRLNAEDSSIVTVIVPHEPTEEHIDGLERRLGSGASIRFSTISDYRGERIIIVDSIGILTTMYKYASVAYVGGSFRQGIHNVLEPAVYGIPVVFGPRHANSHEAVALAEMRGCFSVDGAESAYQILRTLFSDESARMAAGAICGSFVTERAGATERFLSYLAKVIDYPAVQPKH